MANPTQGTFMIFREGELLAEMGFSIQNTFLTVFAMHKKNKSPDGVEQLLFETMVGYARENYLIVVPNDPFVSKCLAERSELYEDIFYETY